ncbi:MAG: NAD-dependent malic enzyme [Candidatus Tectomicrobia bacterium]|uniref:NAD-dependent malic enzyme n=1 Tax=Tectimicrobiota bacterium TaxID=2528274 RepID=A0A937W176_UNCTE|nr:NAD-dependent malic enzyme [Candidatus Tectomicrobia bacterium]
MADVTPSASYSVTLRLEIQNQPGMLGKVTSEIGLLGGDLGAIDIVSVGRGVLVRDITVNCRDIKHAQSLIDGIGQIQGVKMLHQSDRTFLMHLGGKIEVKSRAPIRNRDELSMAYTPGVARVCMAIYDEPKDVFNLTIKRNTVAVVTDGTAVLGLGDIGPAAAMPVMEGKCALFKEFANVDAFPICIDSKDPNVIVDTVKRIATVFGGINLEDIAAPRCFEIEQRLEQELDIPVFHDDQHGTSIVTLAALLNALKIVKKDPSELKVVFNGVGASGVATSKIFMDAGVRNIIGCDTAGAIYKGRTANMNFMKDWYAEHTNPEGEKGSLRDVIEGADVFVGLSGPNTLTVEMVRKMGKDPIVFAMANPVPEIMPELAVPYVRIMATGRSDYPNQINNVLGFPGIFRGALDARARLINDEMKRAAAHAIAETIPAEDLSEEYIIPSVFNKAVVQSVAQAVAEAAYRTGVARRESKVIDDVQKLQR